MAATPTKPSTAAPFTFWAGRTLALALARRREIRSASVSLRRRYCWSKSSWPLRSRRRSSS